MQISEHIHALHIPFRIPVAPDKSLERFVYAYWIKGSRVCVIDAGVAGSGEVILDAIRDEGGDPRSIGWLVLTHAHPDHIGGARGLRQAADCAVLAHHDDAPWIWDVDRQARERPVPGFRSLVEGPVVIDRLLRDEERIELGDAGVLTEFHTPGHSKGHIALYHEPDGALFCGDALPVPGQIPIYDDPVESIRSIRRLRDLPRNGCDIQVLLSSWDEPRRGDAVDAAFEDGIKTIRRVHEALLEAKAAAPDADIRTLTARTLRAIGLPESLANPLLFRAMEAHLRQADHPELVAG